MTWSLAILKRSSNAVESKTGHVCLDVASSTPEILLGRSGDHLAILDLKLAVVLGAF